MREQYLKICYFILVVLIRSILQVGLYIYQINTSGRLVNIPDHLTTSKPNGVSNCLPSALSFKMYPLFSCFLNVYKRLFHSLSYTNECNIRTITNLYNVALIQANSKAFLIKYPPNILLYKFLC